MYDETETTPIRQLLELTNEDDLKARPGGGRTGGRKPDASSASLQLQLLRCVRGMKYGEEAIRRKARADKNTKSNHSAIYWTTYFDGSSLQDSG